MNRVDFLRPSQLDDRVDVEIAADRLAGLADFVSLIGLQTVGREPVLMRIDRDGADTQLMRRAKNPDRDLAAIGRQQLAEVGHLDNSPSGST